MTIEEEEFQASLPRSRSGNGDDLAITERRGDGAVVITDGARSAAYKPLDGEPLGGELRIVPGDVELGRFAEANLIALTDGVNTLQYVPARPEDLRSVRANR